MRGATVRVRAGVATIAIAAATPACSEEAWFELGVPVAREGDDGEPSVDHAPLDVDVPVALVRGGQGSLMIPLSIQGDGFAIPGSGRDRVWPGLDVRAELRDEPGPVDRPLFAIDDYPVWFEREAGVWTFPYFGMVLPNDVDDPAALVGRIVDIEATLRPAEGEPLTTRAALTIGSPPA